MSVGLVVLAAGGSSRLGRAKQLLAVDGETLLRRSVRAAMASTASHVVVVLGAEASVCAAEISDLPACIVIHSTWRDGIASSIGRGLQAVVQLDPELDAVVFAVCDQPHLTAGVFNALVRAHEVLGKGMIASSYDDVMGVPALFSRRYFEALLSLTGDDGARSLFNSCPEDLACSAFPKGGTDIDTAADYARLQGCEITAEPAQRSAGAARPAMHRSERVAVRRQA